MFFKNVNHLFVVNSIGKFFSKQTFRFTIMVFNITETAISGISIKIKSHPKVTVTGEDKKKLIDETKS